MNYSAFLLLLGLLSFSSLLSAQTMKLSCSHPEICKLMNTIAEEQGTRIETESIVNMSGDPHEFEPTISELKKLMGASFLVEGPFELNPWIKKVNYQRSKNSALVTKALNLVDRQVAYYSSTTKGHTKEALAHFWLYPKIYCEFKAELTQILVDTKVIVLKKKIGDQCNQKAIETESLLRLTLSQLRMPLVLTHDALWPLLNSLNDKKVTIVAIKGSGHHEEASTDSVKKLYDALKAPKVIWIEEKGINIPPSILNKKRTGDIVLKLDTAVSSGKEYFSVIKKLNDELSQFNGKK